MTLVSKLNTTVLCQVCIPFKASDSLIYIVCMMEEKTKKTQGNGTWDGIETSGVWQWWSALCCIVQRKSLPGKKHTHAIEIFISCEYAGSFFFDWGERMQLPTTLNKTRTTQCHIVQLQKITIKNGIFFLHYFSLHLSPSYHSYITLDHVFFYF